MQTIFNTVSILFFILGMICITILFFTYASFIAIRLAAFISIAFILGMVIYGGALLIKKLL